MDKPFAITLDLGSSRANHTGSWRTSRPTYVDRLPPCNSACPAGEDIQGWLALAEQGDYYGAWLHLVRDNPLPAIMGRACYHPCETGCNRRQIDESVSIHAVERFLGDQAIAAKWRLEAPAATGKRVLVIGSGPSGLSAAYHLARFGHHVTIREALPHAGGMMRYGIPRYRLPREVVDAEIKRILDLGVRLELGAPVTDLQETSAAFDACFAAVGAQIGERVDIPTFDTARIIDAVRLLRGVEEGEPIRIGRRVVVYGGGDTAVDAARTAARLGAEETCIVYRRTRAKMPAQASEVAEALDEGIEARWLHTIQRFDAAGLVLERVESDTDGTLRGTGELETLGADTLVLAVGQLVDLSLFDKVDGVRVKNGAVEVDGAMMTGQKGLFAGGDMVPSKRTIATAVGHGKKAARHIDAFLRGAVYAKAERHDVAEFKHINPWYYSDADRTVQPALEALRRRTNFEEIHGGLTTDNALFEARRCLSCGNCFECDNCYGVCPDNAVIKLGPGGRFRIDLDFCKGCGLCAAECPCGAIAMVPEEV